MTLFSVLALLLVALPKGFWLWVALAVIVVLYLGRRRNRKTKVSSRL